MRQHVVSVDDVQRAIVSGILISVHPASTNDTLKMSGTNIILDSESLNKLYFRGKYFFIYNVSKETPL